MQVEMPSRRRQAERHDRSGVIWFVLVAGSAASVLGALAWRDSARDDNAERLAQGSAELAQRLGDDEVQVLGERHHPAVAREVVAHGGAELDEQVFHRDRFGRVSHPSRTDRYCAAT